MRGPELSPRAFPMRLSLALRFLVLGLGLSLSTPAFADKKKSAPAAEEVSLDEEKSSTDAASEDSEKKEGEEAADEEKKEGEKAEGDERPVPPEDERKETSPVEHVGETY